MTSRLKDLFVYSVLSPRIEWSTKIEMNPIFRSKSCSVGVILKKKINGKIPDAKILVNFNHWPKIFFRHVKFSQYKISILLVWDVILILLQPNLYPIPPLILYSRKTSSILFFYSNIILQIRCMWIYFEISPESCQRKNMEKFESSI